MPNLKTLAPVGAVVFAAGAALVYACGPMFPMQLLDDRGATLFGTPSNSFAYEAAHLLMPRAPLPKSSPAPANAAANAAASAIVDPDKAAEAGLSAHQIEALHAMAKSADGDAAYAQGNGVPEAQRLYAAAMVDLTAAAQPCAADAASSPKAASAATAAATKTATSDPSVSSGSTGARSACPNPDALRERATARLESILKLPPAAAAPRAMSAASTLADLASDAAADCSNNAGCVDKLDAAYARMRALARQGTPDPAGLAAESWGDEALLDLRSAPDGQACNWLSFANATACAAGIPTPALKHAIALYAQGAASGSARATESLQFIADWALQDISRASALIDDPTAQRLLVSYALARTGDVIAGDADSTTEYRGSWDRNIGPSGYVDIARESHSDRRRDSDRAGGNAGDKANGELAPNPHLAVLVDAIRERNLTHVGDADRLAALAYRTGRYDLAATLIDGQTSALANWVRAKLALRRGDTAAAARAYATAARAFASTDASVEQSGTLLLQGERGVLSLARGQYVEALGLFYDAAQAAPAQANNGSGLGIGYGDDLAYVAERVLTTDELKRFVDARVAATKAPPAQNAQDNSAELQSSTPGDTLRYLLARRLMRDGRFDDAMAYFPADGDPRFETYSLDDDKPKPSALRTWARQYAQALHTAQHAWLRTTRAQAWYDAAQIAKIHGMELLGYEQGPDFTDVGGIFSDNSGRDDSLPASHPDSSPDESSASSANAASKSQVDTPIARAQRALPGPFVTANERLRYASSESQPDLRFHYRSVAADYAQRAADLLPARSQAYAAVLCEATAWTLNDQPERAQDFYRQYVKHGAFVDFGAPFGQECGKPDFRAARFFAWTRAKRDVLRYARGHMRTMKLLAGALALAAACGALLLWRRRKPAER